MNLNTLTSFEGRIGRQTWWIGYIGIAIYNAILAGIASYFGVYGVSDSNPATMEHPATPMTLVFVILALVSLWPSLALAIKRWHDRNKSGWWVLIGLVPVIGNLWMLIELGFLRGDDGANRFGPPAAA